MSACAACLRRSWLLARLAEPLERARGRSERLPEVLGLSDPDLLQALGGRDRERLAHEHASFEAPAARRRCSEAAVEPICRHDEDFPAVLHDLGDPPAALFVAGSLDRFLKIIGKPPRVAVVGARRASGYGLEVAAALGRGLAAAGVTVVSGMALGVDSAAHEGALAAEGATVAVLAGGPERPYPATKARLHARIRETGAVVSELPPGARAMRWSFPARNRVIAALAAATVVVEAGEQSGSLITATLAQELGRDVGAVPGRVTSSVAAGTNALLADGAHIVRGAQDALDLVCAGGSFAAPGARPPLDTDLAAVLSAVDAGRDSVQRLCGAGFAPHAATAALAELELLGYVGREPGGRYAVKAR